MAILDGRYFPAPAANIPPRLPQFLLILLLFSLSILNINSISIYFDIELNFDSITANVRPNRKNQPLCKLHLLVMAPGALLWP